MPTRDDKRLNLHLRRGGERATVADLVMKQPVAAGVALAEAGDLARTHQKPRSVQAWMEKAMNQPLNADPVEGSRDVIDRELRRQEHEQNRIDHLPGVEVSGQPQGGAVDRAAREDRIRTRAHELWEKNGRPERKEREFWFQAEREIKAAEQG
jgi:hypothetical protein